MRMLFAVLAITTASSNVCWSQGAFPSPQGNSHQFPTDAVDSREAVQDEDNVEFRPKTPEDEAKLKQAQAGKIENKNFTPVNDPETSLPNAPIIRGVEVVGASDGDAKKAIQVLTTKSGEALNPDKQRADINKLYELGIFRPNIIVEAQDVSNGVVIKYVVEPNPKISSINFQGNVKVPTNRLMSQLPVKVGETYTNQAQTKVQENIARYYDERGYGDAAVRIEERTNAEGNIDLVLSVDEGTQTKIRNLQIRGAHNINEAFVKLKANNRGSWGPFKRYYNESKFEQDMEVVRREYANKGFLDADVHRGEFLYSEDQSWVDPVIEVNEGPQYRIGSLDANGFTLFTRDEILEPFRTMQGQVFNASDFEKRAEKIKNLYGDEGFVTASVTPDYHKDPNTGMVDINIQVSEGARIYVGEVRIVSESYPEDAEMGWLRRFYNRFSPPVKDEVVQREVRMRPGQVYRRFDEVRSRERLNSLNVFESVQIHEQLTGQSNVRDLVVQVEQGDTASLIFGVGFGDIEGGFVYTNYIERNLFGMARDLKVSLMLGTRSLSGEVSYLDRYFMGQDLAAQFTAFHRQYRRNNQIDQDNTGVTAEFTRPWDDYVKDSIKLRLDAVGFDVDGKKPKTNIDDYLAATIKYKITRDTRDDTFFPTQGSILGGGVETGVADSFLFKFDGQFASYYALNDDWVFANNTMLGLMPMNADKIGYADRFFMGGSGDLRGFQFAGAGPVDQRRESIPLGGSTKLVSQFEMRRRFTENLAGVVFADVGMLGHDPLEFDSPRASVGTGVRLRLPVASVSIDLGVPVVKKKTDETRLIHFNITSAF